MPFLSLSLFHSIIFRAESEEGKRSLDETLVAEAITMIEIVGRKEDSMVHFADCDLHPHLVTFNALLATLKFVTCWRPVKI